MNRLMTALTALAEQQLLVHCTRVPCIFSYPSKSRQGMGGMGRLLFLSILLSLLWLGCNSAAQEPPRILSFHITADMGEVEIELDPMCYQVLENAAAPDMPFVAEAATLNVGRVFFRVDPINTNAVLRYSQVSIFAPMDLDRDGIDDLYEMLNPDLNPLAAGDADDDPDGNGQTHLEEYRLTLGLSGDPDQVYSRETTIFNLGGKTASFEANSRELTIYNGPDGPNPSSLLQVYSRELSCFNLGSRNNAIEAIGREISMFNFPSQRSTVETLSREVSAYNGEIVPPQETLVQITSREVSAFNFGGPSAGLEAISRELTVLNFQPN